MTAEFPQYFEHSSREREIYRAWEEAGAFRADAGSDRKPFVITMPPPNATGTLHLGHAVMLALEDLMIRWRRMQGYEALWVPGTDHAAIATESTVIRLLQKQEKIKDPRRELGREGLLDRIAEYIERSRTTIRSQIRAMGASCDWSRERYTMDSHISRIVNEVFARMFRDGLIYRGIRIVNWDTALQTTVSDDEMEMVERPAKLYTIRYGPLEVATSRPEAKLGDNALAVHPDDDRYKKYVGQEIEVPWPKGPTIRVRVIADAVVDPEFGTGVVGMTPAHSMEDFEIAQRHGLSLIEMWGEDGRMTAAAGPYAGLRVEACREAFVRDLEEAGLLVGSEEYTQKVAICYRSGKPIEYLPKRQWFIDVNRPAVRWANGLTSIRQVMQDVVRSGRIRILPRYEEKSYFNWVDNLRDWCISRQIWWGHRIPVWYRGSNETFSGPLAPEGNGWEQDPDTLDTWFSSALWTWSTLVDPGIAPDSPLDLDQRLSRSIDYKRFHPTSVMETGYDILFFWVARMILMTTYITGDIPFESVYLHGLVLDKNGNKMTKSKPEMCIDPLDVIRDRGADALRLSLVAGTSPGADMRLGDDKLKGCGRFINKLWNAAKLVAGKAEFASGPLPLQHPVNRWMRARLSSTIEEVTGAFERSGFGDGADALRNAFWTEFCDFYLEATKTEDFGSLPETQWFLGHAFDVYLRLLHPLIPFITEDIWQRTGHSGFLMNQPWPHADEEAEDRASSAAVGTVIRLIGVVRTFRTERKIRWGTDVDVRVVLKRPCDILPACSTILQKVAGIGRLEESGSLDEIATISDVDFDLIVTQV